MIVEQKEPSDRVSLFDHNPDFKRIAKLLRNLWNERSEIHHTSHNNETIKHIMKNKMIGYYISIRCCIH